MSDVTTTKFDRFRNHLEKNKAVYIVGATCLAAGVVVGAALVRTGDVFNISAAGDNNQIVAKAKTVNQVMIEMVERSTASKPVHLVGSNLYFNSLNEAARETGHSLAKLSRHINGHISDIDGDVFELLTLAE